MTNTEIKPASNSDVLKRFGRSTVMGRAWFAFKYIKGYMGPRNFAEALRNAWAGLRAEINRANEQAAKAAKAKASYTGRRNSRSPLNPHNQADANKAWGKGSSRYLNTVMGA